MYARRLWLAAGLTVAGVTVMSGCSEDDSGTGPDTIRGGRLFVVESDFQSGLLETVDLDGDSMGTFRLEIHSDAVVRGHGGFAYVLERYGADNVMKIDPSKSGAAAVVYQKHLGDNWNPSDIEFVSETKAYITNMNHPVITVWNPANGEATGSINIAAYTFNPDSNSSPHANQMVLVGTSLYVALQRRNGWQPGGPTIILTINTQTDQVVDADTCRYPNSYDMVYAGGALYISNPGSVFSSTDGAIEKFDLATGVITTVITESSLGGNPNQIVHAGGTRFYVQNYVGWQNVQVVEIDAASGTVVATLPGITDAFGGIAYDQTSGKLYVGERGAGSAGVLVFRNNARVAGPLRSENSLPPSSIAVVR